MALYKYTAMTLDGKNRHGDMEAANEKALKEQLKEQGLYLVSVKDSKAKKEYRRLTSKAAGRFLPRNVKPVILRCESCKGS